MLKYENAYKAYLCINESKLLILKDSLFKSAMRYANIRAEWSFIDLEQRKEQDIERTAAHNRFIDACNIMARNMRNNNEDDSWTELIGKERKYIGDFASYIHAFIGIQNR